jgi:DNA polymerase-3 subunit delta
MRAFAQAERFVSEVEARKLRPVYVFVGDEVFFRKQCRDAILRSLVPNDLREFSLFDFDLAETDLASTGPARTPSLMAPFQIFCARSEDHVRAGANSNEEKLNAIERYCKDRIRMQC